MEGKNTESKNVKSIEKAFNILMLFDWEEKELTLTEVAKRMNMAKSTASRLLGTLMDLGFLDRNPDNGKYILGSKIYYLGQIARDTNDLGKICLPMLQELTKVTRETTHVYIYSNLDRICLEQVESPQVIKQSVKIGSVEPIWHGASGKAILANLGEDYWVRAAERKFGPGDLPEKQEFYQMLQDILDRGISIRIPTGNDSVGCVAAPVFDMYGKVQGALAVSTPSFRFPEDSSEMETLVREGAKTLSRQLGYRG